MQILISELEDGLNQDEIKVSPKELLQNLILRCGGLLKKEKEVIVDAYNSGQQIPPFEYAEKYYNETFNTKEK